MHIKLRLSSRFSRIEQQLRGGWAFLPPVHPTASRPTPRDGRDGRAQPGHGLARPGERQRMCLDGLRGFRQTAMGRGPPAAESEPVWEAHREQGGRALTEAPPGFRPARLVSLARALPPLAQALNVPPHAPRPQGLPQRQARAGQVGHQHRPRRQGSASCTDLAPFVAGGLPPRTASGRRHVRRDWHGHKARRQTGRCTPQAREGHGCRGLSGQACQEVETVAWWVLEGCLGLQTGPPEAALRSEGVQSLDTPGAPGRDPQGSRWEGGLRRRALGRPPGLPREPGEGPRPEGPPDRACERGLGP
jgi:hypothetical protein